MPPVPKVLIALLLVSPFAHAQERFTVVGGYGFDWLKPKAARCTKVDEVEFKELKPCKFSGTGAFGLPVAYYTCPRTKGGEMLVFRNAADCNEALETMQANGP